MFYIVQCEERPNGFVNLSTSNSWAAWLNANIPEELAGVVRHRLRSNLKHLLVGLELKAGLVQPHHDDPGVLFEPYNQNLILEFCIGAYSVLEGLGAAHWLSQSGLDGADSPNVRRQDWSPALCHFYDPDGVNELAGELVVIQSVRDRLHQDQLGKRDDIDWHAMTYGAAFQPASSAISSLLSYRAELVPGTSNLR